MKQWLLNIVISVIITTILSIILPNGKMGKYIKNFFSFLIVLIILNPIINIDFKSIDYDMIFNLNSIKIQTDFIDYSLNKKIAFFEEKCVEIAKNCGIDGVKVNINYELSSQNNVEIQNVIISLQNAEFISDKVHIDIIEELKVSVAKYLNIRTDLVVFYE